MKYSVGQKVRIKSLDWYNRYTNGTEVDCGAYPFTSDMKEFCGQERIIANVCQECYLLLGIDDRFVWTDEMIEGLVEGETKPNVIEEAKTYWDSIKDAWICPQGYQFVDENGNVINAMKIVLEKKKKSYPKTYEECCYVLGFENTEMVFEADYRDINPPKEQWKRLGLMNQFYQLLICRDAYWKIAGEEMGLGKPWEPDWSIYEHKFCLGTDKDKVIEECVTTGNRILAFPTKEMRDAFYENFKELVEQCKELL